MNEMKFVRRVSLLTLITFAVLAAATSRPGYTSTTDIGTLTDQGHVIYCGSYGFAAGYLTGTFGAYSPGLTGGTSVDRLFEYPGTTCGFSKIAIFGVTGFSSDPGSSWLISITCNGVTNYGSSGYYSYYGGEGTWEWTTEFGFATTPGALGHSIPCTIVHN